MIEAFDANDFAEVSDLMLKEEFVNYVSQYKILDNKIVCHEDEIERIECDIKKLTLDLYDEDTNTEIYKLKSNLEEKTKYTEKKKELDDMYLKKCRMLDNIKNLLQVEGTHSLICPVCFEKNVNSFIRQCGHTFCSFCINSVRHKNCPMCRSHFDIFDIKSLIFS